MNTAKYSILIVLLTCLLFSCKTQSQDAKASGAAYTNLEVAQFKTKMNDPNVIILDVRTQSEVDAGHIDGMIHIDVNGSAWDEEIAKLDKDKEYLVYCRSGGRSVTACNKMNKAGFTKLNNLLGGHKAWVKNK